MNPCHLWGSLWGRDEDTDLIPEAAFGGKSRAVRVSGDFWENLRTNDVPSGKHTKKYGKSPC